MHVHFLPLVRRAVLPTAAPAATRARVPSGYGVQEQCVPFTAASATGLLVLSPFAFGLCARPEVPPDAHAFTAPLDDPGREPDARVFYVVDDPECDFTGNAFRLTTPTRSPRGAPVPVVPGLSFFDRADQLDQFKLHLPYICRTDEGVDTLYLPPVNRHVQVEVLSGLVETDWYAYPVNLVLRKPRDGRSVHVAKGDPLAQLVFIPRSWRRPEVTVVADHARQARTLQAQMDEWRRLHAMDRSAYKRLLRTQHGRVDPSGNSDEGSS